MDYKKFKFTGNKPVKIVLLGDIHWGAKNVNTELFLNTIEKLKHEKDTKIILMGDIIENASALSVGSGVYDQKENPNEQIQSIIKILKPLSKQILFFHQGNHERRSVTYCGVSPGNYISDALGIPYVENMSLIDVFVGKQKYRLFTWHGAGSAQSTAGRIKVLERQSESFTADLYAQGHGHDLFSTTIPHREIVNDKFKDIFRHYILTGSFCSWDSSYAEVNGYKMMKLGCPKITLNNKEKEITVDLNYAGE